MVLVHPEKAAVAEEKEVVGEIVFSQPDRVNHNEVADPKLIVGEPTNEDEALELYVKAEAQAQIAKEALKVYEEQVSRLIEFLGVGKYFKTKDGVIHKTDNCLGRFVKNRSFQVKSTRVSYDSKGQPKQRTLSKKEAEEAEKKNLIVWEQK